MFLTNEQAEERLKSEKNLANRFSSREAPSVAQDEERTEEEVGEITHKVLSLPGKNRINLTRDERTDIAIRTRTGEAQSQVARALNIQPLTVHNIDKGKTKGIDEERVQEVINIVKDRALDRLMHSLGLLSDDKLSGCTAKDLSVIASNMGRVVEKISPREEKSDNINFIIYSPELKQERAYKTIEV
jgi:hypothetical protein